MRKELEAKGCVFQTNCDTEVVVHGYKVWGDDALQKFNGMFGLAIWDVKRRRMVIARDKAGIKLIYYKIQDGALYFGSEIRPVLAALQNKAELDPAALQLFFRYRYTPSPLTLYKGVKKLAPGTATIIENGEIKSQTVLVLPTEAVSAAAIGSGGRRESARALSQGRQTPIDERRAAGTALERRA